MEHLDDRLPRRCGRYILFDRIKGGGMAEVYKARLAESAGLDRTLVVKLLPTNADPLAAARFLDEAKIALPLTHGHHHYQFLVDGEPALDPRATGIARNERNERVSLLSVS